MAPGGWHSMGPPASPGQCQGQGARGTVAVADQPATRVLGQKKQKDIARPPRLAGRPRGAPSRARALLAQCLCHSSSQRGAVAGFFLCVFSLVCCADFQWGKPPH